MIARRHQPYWNLRQTTVAQTDGPQALSERESVDTVRDVFTQIEIRRAIRDLGLRKASGNGGFPTATYKKTPAMKTAPTRLANLIFATGYFPKRHR